MSVFLKKVFRFLKPYLEIGGLVISDSGLTFFSFGEKRGQLQKFSLKFPVGVIEEGKLINPKEFFNSLKSLHHQITSKESEKIPVIVSLSDANVYTQLFSLPLLKDANLEEAVRLNLQVISPLDFSRAYSDWQKVESLHSNSNYEIEILSSFISKEIVDSFYHQLVQANFLPLAIEQKAMSIIRLINFEEKNTLGEEDFFVLYIDSDGLSFSIVHKHSLYFNHFSSWSTVASNYSLEREISFADFRNLVIQETHRVINFYSSRFSRDIKNVYLIAPGLEKEVSGILKDNFSLQILPFQIKSYPLELSFACALGAALRGLIPRFQDTEISLAPEGTEIQFFHSQVLSFVRLWRNILIVSLSVILTAFLGIFIFLNLFIKSLTNDLSNISSSYNTAYFNSLKNEANDFNLKVEKALTVKSQQTRWAWLIEELYQKASENKITIERILIQSPDVPIIVNARASSESEAVEFKKSLEKINGLSKVDLPLASLTPLESNLVSFQVTFYTNRQ